MSKTRNYSNANLQKIVFGKLVPKGSKIVSMELQQAGPTRLFPDHDWVSKALEELEKEGRFDSDGHLTPDIDFNVDPKFTCHFKTELSRETKIKLMNAINDMLEHKSQDLLKPPCSIEVTEGDDINHAKVHIIFDSFYGIEPKRKDGAHNEKE